MEGEREGGGEGKEGMLLHLHMLMKIQKEN